ncbi:hypothetical protein [Cupriavidus sp. CuC1]|uniref:hypothetical protein n=1 Tax=Cupriavidus sp. CuC1 TaxID=3373131 RepID=UPI0037D37C6B
MITKRLFSAVLMLGVAVAVAAMATAATRNVDIRADVLPPTPEVSRADGQAPNSQVVADSLDNARSGDGTLYGYRV